jgi:hypothetical protein
MPKYKHVNYNHVRDMVVTITKIKGEPQLLKLLVDDLSRHMSLGIDTHRVMRLLGDKVVEKCEYIDGVMKVTTMVVV